MADDADELVSRFRSPPGWASAFERSAVLVLDAAETAEQVLADYHRLATIVLEEFPPSDQREALLARLAQREELALIEIGGVTVH
jgi:hypothetical protein